ncbi:MAG TPA: hypothetical protein DD381_08735 [Lentisphaeria bacterium]|nr:MAG: hypothetical protein A2X47_08110 [Lentisphaerae bacterium GWF2_38_69]HBM16409.1 hypothetical protein [Lentisphaeria bacterium]
MLEILLELGTIIKQKSDIISLAYLFGSFAKGNAKEYSDIDLAVLLSSKSRIINPLLGLELELEIQEKLNHQATGLFLNSTL